MNRSILSCLILAGLGVTGAAHAGPVYVPVPETLKAGAASYEVEVAVSNTAAQTREVESPRMLAVGAGRTAVVRPGASFRGLLELSGEAGLQYSARLVGGGGSVALPVVTLATAIAAGRTAGIQGLAASASRATDLTLVNLDAAAASCSVSLVGADGAPLGETAVEVAPRAQRTLADVLGGRAVSEARAAVTCSGPFYAFALIADREAGRLSVSLPAGDGDALAAADDVPCPGGAVCFEVTGVVHKPTPETPVKRVAFTLPPATYGRFRMSLDVTVGPWFPGDPDGKHLIYWFVLDKNVDMLGMLYFRGPDSYSALARYGIHLTHPEKVKLVNKGFKAVVGRTYHCENDYDLVHGSITIRITDTVTGAVTQLKGRATNVRELPTKAGQKLLVDMAFPEGKVPDEVPGYGWTYSNVRVEAYRR